ncbi:MAG TPA: DUF4388 domain-containing protein [Desulfobulbaceae bacterium]|nr:DUF4388 domain-containing protein [Desulfobulbaceae bacterium]
MGQTDDNARGRIGGVSLASFLQMLEQERKTCTLVVESGEESGRLYFDSGDLIDAECGGEVGREAVYMLLTWNAPSFRVTESEDRLRRIIQPLAHLLLNAATLQDEQQHEEEKNGKDTAQTNPLEAPGVKNNPALRRLLETIISIAEVRHYYLLNRQGKMIAQSSKNTKIPDFITYSVVSGIQMRKALDVKGPHRIQLTLENGEVLLIFPGAGMIIGLQLSSEASASAVTAKLRSVLTKQLSA